MSLQFATFKVDGRLYGVDVSLVQEVTRTLPLTTIPLADTCIAGLMNLRGQIAPTISLGDFFGGKTETPAPMTVVCRTRDGLLSFLVDHIGDVVEVSEEQSEEVPGHIAPDVRRVLSCLYKLDNDILSIIEIEKLVSELESKECAHVA